MAQVGLTYLTEAQYEIIVDGATGQALDGVWAFFEVSGCLFETDDVLLEIWGFEKCRDAFLEVLGRLLAEGRIKLAKSGVFLAGSCEEQMALFKGEFPKSLEETSSIGGVGTWFFTDACPAGAVWIMKTENDEEWLEWT